MTENAENTPEPQEAAAEASPEAVARALQAVIEEKEAEIAALKGNASKAQNRRRRALEQTARRACSC